jgi:hypothetical protein
MTGEDDYVRVVDKLPKVPPCQIVFLRYDPHDQSGGNYSRWTGEGWEPNKAGNFASVKQDRMSGQGRRGFSERGAYPSSRSFFRHDCCLDSHCRSFLHAFGSDTRALARSGERQGSFLYRLVSTSRLAMPRYYFNTRLLEKLINDPVGEELTGPDQACEFVRLFALGLLNEQADLPEIARASIEVTDENGEMLLVVALAEAAMISPADAPTKH